ncbi:DegT/DnrJ/EryC1/StrS family aminotransferase [Caballeronia sp. LZ001]|nr:DegT/DnrJ/EryC1/StrS family aminotransferase [Caballeronia sp. LZ001]
MNRLYAIARAHKPRAIEDAAQAFGSSLNGKRSRLPDSGGKDSGAMAACTQKM